MKVNPWLHEDRAEEEQKINGGGERFRGKEERAFGRRESVSFRKMGVWIQG